MITKEERDRLKSLSPEEWEKEFMDSTSDAVRDLAIKIARVKAISKVKLSIEPEDFDEAFNREYEKAWNKVKDKSAVELVIMGLLDMMSAGEDISDIIGG